MSSSLHEARRRIERAYDPALFDRAGHRLIEMLSEHLREIEAAHGSVLPWCDPAENVRNAAAILAEAETPGSSEELANRFASLVQTMLEHGHHLHHPRYIGHQVAASVPLAGLMDAVGSVTNQAMAIYDMGPWATAVEWAMVDRLGVALGWQPGEFSGLVTHGGSLANLTALLTARNVRLEGSWERGVGRENLRPVLATHADAHYSIARTAGILGLGTNQVVRLPLDQRRRIDPQRLEDFLRDCRAKNQQVMAVSACACSTPIGAFDPLPEIADLCRRYEVWLHVDAAHGGSACLSKNYRSLVAGLDRADSVVWDAHKMLFSPALCAFVFYRNPRHKFETFRQDAPYLFDPSAPGIAEYDSALKSIECTKRAAAFGLWGVWAMFGQQLFEDLVDVTFNMGKVLFEKLEDAPDFLPLHEPECNIVVFRYLPAELHDVPDEVLGQFQMELRRRVIESGQFYIVSTKLDGVGALRVTIINPLTTPDHLDQLLDCLRSMGKQLLKEMNLR